MAAVFPACGDGTPVARGFGSRQVLQIRDSTFTFQGFGPTSIEYSTSDDGGMSLFSVDLTTGQVQAVAPPDAGSGGEPYACAFAGVAGASTFTVTDPQTGQQTMFEGVSEVWQCPSSASTTLTVLRSDATGALTLWSGTADNLQQVPLPVTIAQQVDSSGLFFAAWPAQPTELGLFAIDPTTFAVTEVIPPVLGTAAWANGAGGTGPLASSSLFASRPSFPTRIGDRYIYQRTMGDGTSIMFVGPFPSGPASELALYEVAPYATLAPFPGFHTFLGSTYVPLPLVAWQYDDGHGGQRSLLVWHDGLQQFVGCPLPAALVDIFFEMADLTKILFGASTYRDYYNPGSTGPLALVSFASTAQGGSGTCTLLSSANASYAGFNLDGSASFWVVQPYASEATLWTAAGDGSGARMIGSGAAIGEPRYVVGTELELGLAGDLVWVDTSDPSNTLHYIAEQVFGTALDVADPWVVTGYDLSHQDATGFLGVVNRETGQKLLISPEVVTYEDQVQQALGDGGIFPQKDAGFGGASPDAGAGSMQIAYLVRGRNPSSQDGIWVATINVGDLP